MTVFETQTTIVRDYANGMADGFINDLNGGHIKQPISHNDLIESFIQYVAKASSRGEN